MAEDTPVTIWLNGEALVADETLGAPFITENGQTMVPFFTLQIIIQLCCRSNRISLNSKRVILIFHIHSFILLFFIFSRQYFRSFFHNHNAVLPLLYIEIGKKYNIRGDLAFAQALKETGYFQFYGSVQDFQNNFCSAGNISALFSTITTPSCHCTLHRSASPTNRRGTIVCPFSAIKGAPIF